MRARTVTLNSGAQMPVIGLGTWPLSDDGAEAAVVSGIDAGFRLIDTAAKYENEEAVGRGIRASGVPRSDLFVVTKLRGQAMVEGKVRGALEGSLARLGLDYVDLYLIHWPMPRFHAYARAFQQMTDLAAEGLIRSVGVSNFRSEHLLHLAEETGLVPAVDQIEADPTIQRRQLRADLAGHGIVPQAWSPLGRGGPLLTHPVVVEAASQTECTPGQVVLRWHLAHGIVPIAKSADPDRQRQNLEASLLPPLPAPVLAALDDLDPLDEGERGIRDSNIHEEF